MRLLYISYWGINDVLTKATVLPNLRILRPYFDEIYVATIERNGNQAVDFRDKGVHHVPFYSYPRLPRLAVKALDFIFFAVKLFVLVRRRKIDVVICRGSMAAAFGVFLHRVLGKPFMVESFEPHADYMADGGTWKKNGIEYKFQKWIEQQCIDQAKMLFPVTRNYLKALIAAGVAHEKMYVMPCCVELDQFQYDRQAREKIRINLKVKDHHFVGVYAGKFGDIYLDEEAFDLFKRTYEFFNNKFFLIILTPHHREDILNRLVKVGIKKELAHVDFVDHAEVPQYLSAADFAFSLIRTSPSRKYCSPIKNGEYWANGLPVLLTKGVGDDEQIIHDHHVGAILDLDADNLIIALQEVVNLLGTGRTTVAQTISRIANRYRHFDLIATGYHKILSKRVTNDVKSSSKES